MSRGNTAVTARCITVWLVTGALALTSTVVAVEPLRALPHTSTHTPFDTALVRVCAAVFVSALAWLWLITTTTMVDLARDSLPSRAGATRRLVHLMCGMALTSGLAGPAVAHASDAIEAVQSGPHLAGLALPDRAVSGETRRAPGRPIASTPDPTHVVSRGESLWSIASATVPGTSPPRDIDARWRRIWALNRHLIGADPDHIEPGQRLRLPGDTRPQPHTHTDGSTP